MKNKTLFILTLIIGFSYQSHAQKQGQALIDSLTQEVSKAKEDTTKVLLMFMLSQNLRGTNVDKAIVIDKEAHAISKKISYKYGIAKALNGVGIGKYFLGDYVEAIICWQTSKDIYSEMGDSRGVANILSNMGAIYFNQSEYTKAIELYIEALKLAEIEKDTLRIASVWQNIGAVHTQKENFILATEAFQKALPLFKAIKNNEGTGLSYLNLAECNKGQKDYANASINLQEALHYLYLTNYYTQALRTMGDIKLRAAKIEEALFYLDSAYNMSIQLGDDFVLAGIVNIMASAYREKLDFQKALIYFEKGKAISLAQHINSELVFSTKGLVEIFSLKGDYKRAFENQKILESAKDSIYNIESDKKINRLLFNFDLEKKENEISLLVKDKKIQQIEVDKQKGIRNMFIGGFAIVLLFSVIVLRQRNKVKREKKNVEIEKARSEELLLNILPEEVAEELKNKGSAEAKLFNEVTVLFTDFKGFSALSEIVTPKELVSDLHHCFTAFDHIIQKNGMEKIKTIGDAYMAAGGLPTPNSTHARDVVNAGLEISIFMEDYKAKKIANNQPYFEIRIGIHTGSVVAGIVGVKKFSYDIWGDTVNTANRMESSGEVGKVNISETTYAIVKDTFICKHRGKVSAKGKGYIDMYFVERSL